MISTKSVAAGGKFPPASAPAQATMAILDNIILQLVRYDFARARQLAELLLRDRMPLPQSNFDVLIAAALSAALQRGVTQIKRNAQAGALMEFNRARGIWHRQLNSVSKAEFDARRESRRTAALPG